MSPARALKYSQAQRQRFLAELKEFIRFPTISAQPKHAPAIRECAGWLADHLRRIGMEHVKVIPTRGHPVVYSDHGHVSGYPTVLVYGHYDVQPVDPLGEWHSPPFEPTVRGEDLYGRGACDDKGQMFTHVKALESYLQTQGDLPVNVKCLFEGEEEIDSPSLTPFLARNRRALAADVAVMSDMPIPAPDRPALTYAVRGRLSLELEVHGPERDLHSGIYGGAIHNPVQVLCEMIAKLHDARNHVAIPGFYSRVRQPTEMEREYMGEVGPSDARILRDAQAQRGWGEAGYTEYERTALRPALTINGIAGGYQGPGVKGIIPNSAVAKISFRLVPDQEPRQVERLFREHIARITPPTVRSAVRTMSRAKPGVVNPKHPAMRAAATAYQRGFGVAPVLLRCGGTIPGVNTFQKVLGIPTVLMGFALPDDHMHAPNEKFHLPNFYNGISTSIWFLTAVGAAKDIRVQPRAEEPKWSMAYDH